MHCLQEGILQLSETLDSEYKNMPWHVSYAGDGQRFPRSGSSCLLEHIQ